MDLIELMKKGLAQAAQFSWQKAASQTVAVYKEVCTPL